MDSFGIDMAEGELFDLGPIWGENATPSSSSSPTNLPFSVGTPTGVQSLTTPEFPVSEEGEKDDAKSNPGSTSTSDSTASTTSKDTKSDQFSSSLFDTASVDQPKEQHEASSKSDTTSNNTTSSKTETTPIPSPTTTSAPSSSPAPTSSSGPTPSAGLQPSPTTSSMSSRPSSLPGSGSSINSGMPGTTQGGIGNPTMSGQPTTASPRPGTVNATSSISMMNNNAPLSMGMSFPMSGTGMTPTSGMITSMPPNSSTSRPHIQSVPMMTPGYSNPMMSNAGMRTSTPTQMSTPGVGSNELAAINKLLRSQPDLIPPPPEVLQAGQRHVFMNPPTSMPPTSGMMMQQPGMGMPNYSMGTSIPGSQPMMGGVGMQGNMMQNPGQAAAMMRQRQMQMQLAEQQRRAQAAAMAASMVGPKPTVAWQSESDLPLRRKMIAKIVSLLQQRKPDAPPEWIKKLPDMARRLEDSLYRTASSKDEYGNFGTLKQRLQHLAITMGAKAANKSRSGSEGGPGMQQQMNPGQNPPGSQQQMLQQMQMQHQMQMQQAQLQRQSSGQAPGMPPGQLQRQTSLQQMQMQQQQQYQQQMRQMQMQQNPSQQNQHRMQMQRQMQMNPNSQQQMPQPPGQNPQPGQAGQPAQTGETGQSQQPNPSQPSNPQNQNQWQQQLNQQRMQSQQQSNQGMKPKPPSNQPNSQSSNQSNDLPNGSDNIKPDPDTSLDTQSLLDQTSLGGDTDLLDLELFDSVDTSIAGQDALKLDTSDRNSTTPSPSFLGGQGSSIDSRKPDSGDFSKPKHLQVPSGPNKAKTPNKRQAKSPGKYTPLASTLAHAKSTATGRPTHGYRVNK